ncbi:helix-turn-helix domain-containing protein [Streptomyces sp. NPDC006175]|uniref:helix-turn-helix domain-containing protein n=1 Tax=Streptomyces sp. NPDC006175 TaxID=3154471 RepID=UPI0033A2DA4B
MQRIVRRGSTSTVRFRRTMMLLASAGGNTVPVIANLVQADQDTVRDVIRRFNEVALACVDPRWAGGRPRLLSDDDEEFVIRTATTRPTKLGEPFTRWSIRKLVDHLRRNVARPIRIGREALRCLLRRRGVTFQRTKTWEESSDPDFDAKLDRIEYALTERPDRTFAFDEFGPLGIRPTAGACWAKAGEPDRLPATFHRTHGVTYFHGCYAVGDDSLSAHKNARYLRWAARNKVELCFTPTNASWANPIKAHFGRLRQFTPANSHPNHTVQTQKLHRHLHWRNQNARHPDVLAAQRRERARVRSEKGIRWGGRPLKAAA